MPSPFDDAAASADRLDTDEVVDEWHDGEEYGDDEVVEGDEEYAEDEYAEDDDVEGEYADGEYPEAHAEVEYDEDEGVEYADEGVEYDDADWDDTEEYAPAPRREIAAFAAGGLSRFRRRRGWTGDATTDPYAEESFDSSAETVYVDEEDPRASEGGGGVNDKDDTNDWEHEDAAEEERDDEDWDDEEHLGDGPYAASPHLDGTATRGRAGGSTAVAPRGGARRAPRTPVLRTPRLPQTRRVTSPQLHPVAAAAATGLLTGLVGVVLTLLTMSGCAAMLGTPSCGGGLGFVGLVVVITVTVLAGRAMMRVLSVPDAAAIAFVGVVTVVVLLLLLAPDSLFSVWMWVVAPLLVATTFAATCALTLSAETSPERP